jgi:hypothetical protein
LGRSNWQDRRNAENSFESIDPTVLIIGKLTYEFSFSVA